MQSEKVQKKPSKMQSTRHVWIAEDIQNTHILLRLLDITKESAGFVELIRKTSNRVVKISCPVILERGPTTRKLAGGEEPTESLTPDKMNRSMKQKGDSRPYPLAEEEATPNVSKSQKQ